MFNNWIYDLIQIKKGAFKPLFLFESILGCK
ncbi:hypothetical protein P872_17640 [Rhodonellum psychrophilum GCM71 = DSM 17998]|uniref:Uncharacterized protein n=1 Tax=Rhodonellum psychrophilum GCM71 = DSM 17998 TaxID=1123057 RepID=U5BY11_9BACT|nr:hypothetical protein P872_17640 [Rhodonellum psychrophilum GCM71 = DSM 17998]